MAITPEYTRKAVDNYRKKFDLMQLRLPKGTKEIIDNKVGKANTHNFVVECVLKALELPELPQEAKADPKPTTEQVKEVSQKQTKELEKAYKEPTSEEIQALQEQINQKKAKQDKRAEELQKQKEERERQEKEERKTEILEYLERIINCETLEEDEAQIR